MRGVAPLLVLLAALPAMAEKPPADDTDSVRVQALLQTRLLWDEQDAPDTQLTIPRARLKLKGRFGKALRYNFSVDFGDFAVELKNAYTDVRAIKKHLQVRVGHFKRPFSRQRLTTAANQGAADRTLLKSVFGSGRDIGLMLHNRFRRGSGLKWAFGVFSDFDLDRYLDTREEGFPQFHPMLAGRIECAMPGLRGFSETDAARGPLRVGGAAAAMYFLDDTGPSEGLRWEADAIAKLRGATLSVQVSGADGTDAEDAMGLYAHAAYRFIDQLEIAGRWAGLFPSDTDTWYEATAALNGYFFGRHLRATIDVGLLHRPVPGAGALDPDGWRVRVQLQVR